MLQIVLLAGKFVFLIVLYLFVYRVVRSVNRELRSTAAAGAQQTGLRPAKAGGSAAAAAPAGPDLVPPGYPAVQARVSEGSAAGPSWQLVVEKSPTLAPGERYAFPVGAHALAGRAPEMDIYLEDTFVSSKHALFEATGEGLQVEDLRSTNGTAVNGEEVVGARLLRQGDKVEVGDTTFRVEVR